MRTGSDQTNSLISWIFEAKKRYELCVFNYVVNSNHIHLLVKDTGEQVIARSMQLIAGRAGVVQHPTAWAHGGYQEIQKPPKRYRIIDVATLMNGMKYGQRV